MYLNEKINFLWYIQLQVLGSVPVSLLSDGHMTPEEVERHLESRQTYLELVPEKAPPTVPTEMFSNDPSLDRYVSIREGGNILHGYS
jgi:hypothetical protein